ncbi:hypothetical protein [Cellulosimicrobium marinum]|uniref:hypothetical protein n=1 Tax=Cellulosimicrobium marinum TaxID=1638992 RepID=UPI001E5A8494|nr:hypothetical protein [Cellulosimicrobium marinum]MCB7135658.1 hypothetical protein [Cellulosimicrobium marinum]
MAWWDDEKRPTLADQLADTSRPVSTPPPDDDASAGWAAIPLWLLLGAALVAGGVALAAARIAFGLTAIGAGVVAWGGYLLSQFGVLGWYALRVPRLRAERVAAADRGDPDPALTDLDVRSWRVPVTWAYGRLQVGLLGPGDGAAPRALRVARVVGGWCAGLMLGLLVLGGAALALSRAGA